MRSSTPDCAPGARVLVRDLASELMRRSKGRRILVVTTQSMMTQFQKEFWAAEFDAWLVQTVELPDAAERTARLQAWERAPSVCQAHPREEHLLPLMVAAGGDAGRRVFAGHVWGIPTSGFRFG